MKITLDLRPETLHRFMATQAALTDWLGWVPSLEWLIALAVDSCNPVDLEKLFQCASRDQLKSQCLSDLPPDSVEARYHPRSLTIRLSARLAEHPSWQRRRLERRDDPGKELDDRPDEHDQI